MELIGKTLKVKSNYKRNPVYKQENHCLFRAMQALLVSMKIPNVLWGMAGRDKTDLRSLFQQPGLFMEQNFNRIRAATQSPEIDEFFKKIPKNAVTKYSGRPSEKSSSDVPSSDTKPKPDPEKNLVNIILGFYILIYYYGLRILSCVGLSSEPIVEQKFSIWWSGRSW